MQFILLFENNNFKVLGISINIQANKIAKLTNRVRQENNLPQLKLDERLTSAALAKANDMLEFGYWDHFSPSHRSPWKFVIDAGYNYQYTGENLAKDYLDEEEVIEAWLNSPSHRANLLSDKYEDIGIAVVSGKLKNQDVVLIVQMFGKEFSSEDMAKIEQSGGIIISKDSNDKSEIIGKINKNKFNLGNFNITKFLAITIIIGLFTVVSIDIFKNIGLKQFRNKAKKYWVNLLFLMILGAIIYLTKDGSNI